MDTKTAKLSNPNDESSVPERYLEPEGSRGAVDTKLTNPKAVVGTRKAPMSVVPMNVMMETGVAMLEGALKYGRHNYRECGARASVYLDGTMRHLAAWWEGEDIDPESGLSHVTKAIASLVVLRDAMMQVVLEDDRPPAGVPFMPELNRRAGEILDRYGGREVRHYTRRGGRQESAGQDGGPAEISQEQARVLLEVCQASTTGPESLVRARPRPGDDDDPGSDRQGQAMDMHPVRPPHAAAPKVRRMSIPSWGGGFLPVNGSASSPEAARAPFGVAVYGRGKKRGGCLL